MVAASGLLALYWFGRLADLVGVLGCCNPSELMPFEPQFLAMLGTMNATRHLSPYDALPLEHPVLNGEADEFTLRVIADGGAIHVPADISYVAEARAINQRRLALRVWTMPDEMHGIIAAAGHRWFNSEHKAWKSRDPIRFGQASRPLRQAYAVADSNVEVDIALAIVLESLRQWFYVNAMPEPPPETVEEWVRLAEEPGSRTSRAIAAAYRSYGLLREHE